MPFLSLSPTRCLRWAAPLAIAMLAVLVLAARAQADPVLTGTDRPTLSVQELYDTSNARYSDAVNVNARKVLEQGITNKLSTHEFPLGDVTSAGTAMESEVATAVAGDAEVAAGATRLSMAARVLPTVVESGGTIALAAGVGYVGWRIGSGIRSLFVHAKAPPAPSTGSLTYGVTWYSYSSCALYSYGAYAGCAYTTPSGGAYYLTTSSPSVFGDPRVLSASDANGAIGAYTDYACNFSGWYPREPALPPSGWADAGFTEYDTSDDFVTAPDDSGRAPCAGGGFRQLAVYARAGGLEIDPESIVPYTSQDYTATTTTDDDMPEDAWTPTDVNDWANAPDNQNAATAIGEALGAPDPECSPTAAATVTIPEPKAGESGADYEACLENLGVTVDPVTLPESDIDYGDGQVIPDLIEPAVGSTVDPEETTVTVAENPATAVMSQRDERCYPEDSGIGLGDPGPSEEDTVAPFGFVDPPFGVTSTYAGIDPTNSAAPTTIKLWYGYQEGTQGWGWRHIVYGHNYTPDDETQTALALSTDTTPVPSPWPYGDKWYFHYFYQGIDDVNCVRTVIVNYSALGSKSETEPRGIYNSYTGLVISE